MGVESGDICYLTAKEAIELFKNKELSPVELMQSVISRCEAQNEKLKLYCFYNF